MVVSLYILTILWVVSVFSFARLRISFSSRGSAPIKPHKDWICIGYLRISGIFILFVIFSLINLR